METSTSREKSAPMVLPSLKSDLSLMTREKLTKVSVTVVETLGEALHSQDHTKPLTKEEAQSRGSQDPQEVDQTREPFSTQREAQPPKQLNRCKRRPLRRR